MGRETSSRKCTRFKIEGILKANSQHHHYHHCYLQLVGEELGAVYGAAGRRAGAVLPHHRGRQGVQLGRKPHHLGPDGSAQRFAVVVAEVVVVQVLAQVYATTHFLKNAVRV